jgi:hypothetical protein
MVAAKGSRPAQMASSGSLLAPVRPRGRLGRSISTTHSPWSSRKLARPAPEQPVPSSAQQRRPAARMIANPSSCWQPAWSLSMSHSATTPPLGSRIAAAWRSRWVSTR